MVRRKDKMRGREEGGRESRRREGEGGEREGGGKDGGQSRAVRRPPFHRPRGAGPCFR